jgi:hypothetical protein
VSAAQDLYGLPRDEFISARSALAKELRKQGKREQAESVAKLPKPSIAAWAVNQLVRTQKRQITKLLKAGDALQRAQSELLGGGGDREQLQQALARQREAVAELVELARGLLGAKGEELSGPTLDRVAATLEAAALDAQARSQVESGCLEHELQHVGLGSADAGSTSKRGASAQRSQKTQRAHDKRIERKHAERRKADRRAEQDARRAAEHAERERDRARRRRDEAASDFDAAEAGLAAATEAFERASAAYQEAKQRLDSR